MKTERPIATKNEQRYSNKIVIIHKINNTQVQIPTDTFMVTSKQLLNEFLMPGIFSQYQTKCLHSG